MSPWSEVSKAENNENTRYKIVFFIIIEKNKSLQGKK